MILEFAWYCFGFSVGWYLHKRSTENRKERMKMNQMEYEIELHKNVLVIMGLIAYALMLFAIVSWLTNA